MNHKITSIFILFIVFIIDLNARHTRAMESSKSEFGAARDHKSSRYLSRSPDTSSGSHSVSTSSPRTSSFSRPFPDDDFTHERKLNRMTLGLLMMGCIYDEQRKIYTSEHLGPQENEWYIYESETLTDITQLENTDKGLFLSDRVKIFNSQANVSTIYFYAIIDAVESYEERLERSKKIIQKFIDKSETKEKEAKERGDNPSNADDCLDNLMDILFYYDALKSLSEAPVEKAENSSSDSLRPIMEELATNLSLQHNNGILNLQDNPLDSGVLDLQDNPLDLYDRYKKLSPHYFWIIHSKYNSYPTEQDKLTTSTERNLFFSKMPFQTIQQDYFEKNTFLSTDFFSLVDRSRKLDTTVRKQSRRSTGSSSKKGFTIYDEGMTPRESHSTPTSVERSSSSRSHSSSSTSKRGGVGLDLSRIPPYKREESMVSKERDKRLGRTDTLHRQNVHKFHASDGQTSSSSRKQFDASPRIPTVTCSLDTSQEYSLANQTYESFLENLKEKVRSSSITSISVLGQANPEFVKLCHYIGTEIIKYEGKFGELSIFIDKISQNLRSAFPDIKAFGQKNIKYMHRFALEYPNVKFVEKTAAPLPWFHIATLLDKVPAKQDRLFYMIAAHEKRWTHIDMVTQIAKKIHNRQGKGLTNFQEIAHRFPDTAQFLFKTPYVFDFLGLTDKASEQEVKESLGQSRHLSQFLSEMGSGFSLLHYEYQYEMDNEKFSINMILHNVILGSYIIVDLKNSEFRPEYAGTMSYNLSIIDEHFVHLRKAPCIGLILCKSKNLEMAKRTLRQYANPMCIAEYRFNNDFEEPVQSIPLPGESVLTDSVQTEQIESVDDTFNSESGLEVNKSLI